MRTAPNSSPSAAGSNCVTGGAWVRRYISSARAGKAGPAASSGRGATTSAKAAAVDTATSMSAAWAARARGRRGRTCP